MAGFGQLLREFRQRAGWTQEELAHHATLSVRSIRDLENDRVERPRPRSVRLLGEALGLSEDEISRLLAIATGLPTAVTGPAQLPATAADFVGRSTEVALLDQLLGSDGARPAVVISAVDGGAGVGKTALALHWAHHNADRFPDGHLYVNLRGYDPDQPPMDPSDALGGFLRALDVAPERLPSDEVERASLFRSTVAGRRMVLVLDNAASVRQVRPLLPGNVSCVTLVTSRERLGGLVAVDGAHPIRLDVLADAEARVLLRRVLGERRVAEEPDATAQLAGLCGNLPLALRIAAAKLALEPAHRIADAVAELSEKSPLSALEMVDDPMASVRTAFELSYRALDDREQVLFRRLGLIAGPDFDLPAAAALLGETEVGPVLDRLVAMHLVENHVPGRFRLHDLLRSFAVARSQADDRDALIRLLDYYLHSADAANQLIRPRRRPALPAAAEGVVPRRFAGFDEAIDWCEVERSNLVAAIRGAAEVGLDVPAYQLPISLIDFLMVRQHRLEWIATHEVGLAAAQRAGDRSAEGVLHRNLGVALRDMGRIDEAVDCYTRAVEIGREDPDPMPLARALGSLGIVRMDQERPEDAIPHFEEALEIARRLDDTFGAAVCLQNLGCAFGLLERLDEADRSYHAGLALFREVGDQHGQAAALGDLGEVLRKRGRPAEALRYLWDSLAIKDAIGDRYGKIESLNQVGFALELLDDKAGARENWHLALEIAEELDDPRVASIRAQLTDQSAG